MSIRPASSWPWLDDALVAAGAFVDAGDDLLAGGGTDAPGSGTGWSLAGLDVRDLGDPRDPWDTSELVGATSTAPPASEHDPFRFEPAPGSRAADVPEGDLRDAIADELTSVLRDAIETAPGFVIEEPALTDDRALDDRALDDRALDATTPRGASGFAELDPTMAGDAFGDTSTLETLETIETLETLESIDTIDTDDPSGDLDNFDGVDDVDRLDDVDGL